MTNLKKEKTDKHEKANDWKKAYCEKTSLEKDNPEKGEN